LEIVNERLTYLFQKQLADGCSLKEKQELIVLLANEGNDIQATSLLKSHWDTFDESLHTPVFEAGQESTILARIIKGPVYPKSEPANLLKLWPRVFAAAIIIVVCSISAVYFFSFSNEPEEIAYNLGQDILPGKSGATLTLANGKKINLSETSNGEIAQQAGVVASKSSNGKLIYKFNGGSKKSNLSNTISTSKGETYEVLLPDGSKVKLNAASSLTFSVNLINAGTRTVSLEGEGYFEVFKDSAHPFIVKGRGQQVEVLGTHFNMNTYGDEPTSTTTLLEGSVQVITGGHTAKIKPGQQAKSTEEGIKISTANLEQVTSWTKGDFDLNHVSFKTAMRDIARWYDVEVIYDASVPNNMESGGWIARDKPLSTVLKSIESSGLVKFKVKDRKIYVMR
jgi:transmembrane sensor